MAAPKVADRYIRHKRLARAIQFFRAHDEFTNAEFFAASGLSRAVANQMIRALWQDGPHRCLRICAWRDDRLGRPTIPVYEFGHGQDAKRRPPMTSKERNLLWQQRKANRAQAIVQDAMSAMMRVRDMA